MHFQRPGAKVTITHWSKVGEAIQPGQEPEIAPGVHGVAFDMTDGIYIPLLRAAKEGNGDVSRFLDSLPTMRRIVFPNVTNGKLRLMLQRRGFRAAWDPECECEIMERLPLTTT